MFLKSPHRISAYKNCTDCRLPPEPIVTRWGTWLEPALFYSENLSKLKELVSYREEDAQSVKLVTSILSTIHLLYTCGLSFIRSHLSQLPNAILQNLKNRILIKYM